MTTNGKRTMITLRPEWEPELDQLKKDQFYNEPQAEMYRQLIRLGLDALKSNKKGVKAEAFK
jgi:hypothetical protein